MSLHDLWYENAIVYCLDVETFADSDGDGIGDFQGLTKRLDYLAGLGITCLWLMPFFPTPNRDDGYDIMDYWSIDPRFGSLADFTEFTRRARERGLHVIIDLVPNHVSDQHPWFQAARKNRHSRYRDYFVWREDDPGDTSNMVVFPGEQKGVWTYDEEVQAYYLHHFYSFQPDLNITNPAVREELSKTIGLWIQLGVDGFRIDAAPFLINLTGVADGGDVKKAHEYLAELWTAVSQRRANGVLLGEVDEGLSTIADYFGGGNQLQMLFNFIGNRHLFLALAEESADPLAFGLQQLPSIPGAGQWFNFLRHHDELNLSRLTLRQRETVFAAFGPEPEMQIYDRGLRRRLAPMLNGDRRRLELAYSLLFSLPGTPMLYYGEEIGMGENLAVKGRLSMRTPMPWNSGPNGGFSTAPSNKLVRPMLEEGEFGYRQVNVAAQRADPNSLLNWMARLIRTRKECPELGWGAWRLLDVGEPSVLAIRSEYQGCVTIVLHNLSPTPCTITLDLSDDEALEFIDMLEDQPYKPLDQHTHRMRLNGYGYRWLRLVAVCETIESP